MKKVSLLFTFMMIAAVSFGQAFTGVDWVAWGDEPDYASTPYDNPEVTIYQKDWTPASDVTSFDEAWGNLPDVYDIANPTDNEGGDPYDLGAGDTYYAQWKAFHDGGTVYVMLMFVDSDNQADAGSRTFEVMVQPTGYDAENGVFRHDPTFQQGVTDADVAKQNMAYARYVELGGGKAMFADGGVTEFHASVGATGGWGANDEGLLAFTGLASEMFWDETGGVIRAVLPMDFDTDQSVLSYPVDAADPSGARTSLAIGDVFSIDVKANATIGDANVQYFWSSDVNNGYASNYYSGHATLSSATNVGGQPASVEDAAYYADGVVYVKGESADLEVFNLAGAKVLSAENVSTLSLDGLSNGLYIVSVNGESAVKVVKR